MDDERTPQQCGRAVVWVPLHQGPQRAMLLLRRKRRPWAFCEHVHSNHQLRERVETAMKELIASHQDKEGGVGRAVLERLRANKKPTGLELE